MDLRPPGYEKMSKQEQTKLRSVFLEQNRTKTKRDKLVTAPTKKAELTLIHEERNLDYENFLIGYNDINDEYKWSRFAQEILKRSDRFADFIGHKIEHRLLPRMGSNANASANRGNKIYPFDSTIKLNEIFSNKHHAASHKNKGHASSNPKQMLPSDRSLFGTQRLLLFKDEMGSLPLSGRPRQHVQDEPSLAKMTRELPRRDESPHPDTDGRRAMKQRSNLIPGDGGTFATEIIDGDNTIRIHSVSKGLPKSNRVLSTTVMDGKKDTQRQKTQVKKVKQNEVALIKNLRKEKINPHDFDEKITRPIGSSKIKAILPGTSLSDPHIIGRRDAESWGLERHRVECWASNEVGASVKPCVFLISKVGEF